MTVSGPLRLAALGLEPARGELRITTDSGAPLAGVVEVEAPWLRAEPARLDPSRSDQVVHLYADPEQTPAGRSRCRVTVRADSGDRQTITVEVRRTSLAQLVALVGGLCAALALLTAWLGGLL